MIGFQNVERKNISLCDPLFDNPGVIVNIGVIGELKGTIIIGMTIESAKKFASKMMMGMQVLEFDELPQSAICEMSNMVCANACTNFTTTGIKDINISTPTLIISNDGKIKLAPKTAVRIEYEIDDIDVFLIVGLFR